MQKKIDWHLFFRVKEGRVASSEDIQKQLFTERRGKEGEKNF